MSESVKSWPEEKMQAVLERAESRALNTGGEPPHNGSMSARLEKLESFAERAGERLTRVEEKLDYLIREVGQFKWWLVGSILTIIVTVLGTSVGIQQMTVATFQGAAQVARDSAPNAQLPQAPPNIIINVPATAATAAPK